MEARPIPGTDDDPSGPFFSPKLIKKTKSKDQK